MRTFRYKAKPNDHLITPIAGLAMIALGAWSLATGHVWGETDANTGRSASNVLWALLMVGGVASIVLWPRVLLVDMFSKASLVPGGSNLAVINATPGRR